ncbi:hypothetical protein VTN96DRAFT_160 [Rasamsonia emersonii]
MRFSPVLASLANVFKKPLSVSSRPTVTTAAATALTSKTTTSPFSTTAALAKRKSRGAPLDKRITLIRYFLFHPLTPRPLKFSRGRYLRHWTIHRAWQLYQAKQRRARELELQRQQQAMAAACEELRTGCGERGAKLFRIAMNKHGVFTELFPIEYGRLQTDTPPREGWNHDWKRV